MLALAILLIVQYPTFAPPPPPVDGVPPPPAQDRLLFISPVGEPFREDAPDRAWFLLADGDGDGRLTTAEMAVDASRFFKRLDLDGDGEIDPDEMSNYETQIAPEIRVGFMSGDRIGPPPGDLHEHAPHGQRGPGGRPEANGRSGREYGLSPGREEWGATRHGYLDFRQPVASADPDFNRGVDLAELQAAAIRRHAMLDRNNDGSLTAGELSRVGMRPPRRSLPPGPPPGEDYDDGTDRSPPPSVRE